MTNVINPPNTRLSPTFSGVKSYLISSGKDYDIQHLTNNLPTVRTTTAAFVQTYSLTQNSIELDKPALYTIKFTPFNRISSTGSVKLKWPSSVTIYSNVSVTIRTSKSYTTYSSLDTKTREIVWKNIFSSTFSD